MKIVLQKVKHASVTVDQKVVGEIPNGFLILLGVAEGDTSLQADHLVDKILKLRLFEREGSDSFMEQNIVDVGGQILVVSQFTLYGDCKKGTRPSFTSAAKPDEAREMYEYFVNKLREKNITVQTGEFAAHMDVALVNDGPVTLILER